jgi:glc operon protein GlcG
MKRKPAGSAKAGKHKADSGRPKTEQPLPYGPPLSLAAAKRIMAAAEKKALAHGWAVAIVVVDSSASVVMAHKLDDAQHSSVVIATAKAQTAVNFRRPTKMFQEAISAGGEGLRFLAMPGVTPLEGGYPLIVNGAIVGGIGVSGVLSAQDSEIALAGMAAH